ncbi:Uncharacterised protein [Serratia fonticola]|nr:Uncharacterised protein [Serratia fonticola]
MPYAPWLLAKTAYSYVPAVFLTGAYGSSFGEKVFTLITSASTAFIHLKSLGVK